jgi:hypothetical protein
MRTALLAAALSALAFASVLPARTARADEPVAAKEPRLLSETGENTTVIDAFDGDDPFDLSLMLGFEQTFKHANIRRETSLAQPGLTTGGFTSKNENVASYDQAITALNVGADVGLFRDLALLFRFPIILSDSRELTDLDGSSRNASRLQDSNGEQLFSVPHKSPNRSGIDWFSVGLNYAIMNQQRDFTKPTWVVGVEGRFGVGTPTHACTANPGPGLPQCPDPLDPTNKDKTRAPGISRAMTSLVAHTVFSRRFGYVEPYSGFWFLADFPREDTDFGATTKPRGALVNHPPLIGKFTMGVEIIPYERKDRFQRLSFDAKFSGTYHSPGREYSELFDALGSSQAQSLRNPNPGGYHLAPDGFSSVADTNAQKVYFTGITEQQAFGSFGTSGSVTWQSGELVKLTAGMGFQFHQSHFVTGADACNPDFNKDAASAGPCHGVTNGGSGPQPITGIPNPNHRPEIDTPGHRFSVDDTTMVNVWLSGVVMF